MATIELPTATPNGDVEALPAEEKLDLVTQLYDAVQAPDFAAVTYLLNKGVDATAQDPAGEYSSPRCLEIAITNGDEDIACLLINNTPKIWKGAHFDQELYDAVNKGMMEIARLLIEKEDQDQKTRRLTDAVKRDYPKVVEFLLEHGAQIDWQNDLEQTALFEAVEKDHRSAAEVLLRAGARLDITKRDGKTVFDVAMSKKDAELAHIILNRFCSDVGISTTADINLDLALRDKDFPKALDLLQGGADIALRTIRNNCQPGGGSLIGPHNEYFTSLCSTIVALEQKVTSEPKQVQQAQTTESDRHFLCASKWLVECLSQHSNCIKAEDALPLLPSRVIDVGLDESQATTLILSKGKRGRYVALSHRWGSSNITKTTKENINQRLSGIAFSDLTKTMQDAVNITRRLGVRYLWIDAVCIIQDSHSDWSVESCNMAEIYRNALFTIAAAAAANHSEGCFASKDKSGLGGQLDTRGWILQEQLLSRRILTYTFGIIEWQCLSSSASSDNSYGYGLNDSIRFKRALFGFRSTSMTLQKQAYASWQDILTSYSRRTLTNESDKLMAILGIAKFIESTLEDTFLSGLWENQLYRDLLWSASSPSGNSRIKGIELPSWSWASNRSSISHSRWPAGSTPTYLKPAISLVSTDLDRSLSSDAICKRLTVRGILQKVQRDYLHGSSNLVPWEAQKKRDESPVPSQTLGQAERELKEDNLITPVEKPTPKTRSFFGWRPASLFGRRKEDIKPQRLPPPKEQDIDIRSKAANPAFPHSHGRSLKRRPDMLSENPDLEESERRFAYWSAGGDLSMYDNPGADLKENHRVSAEFWPDIKPEGFNEAWVLPVATEHYWMHGVVLVPTNKERTEFRRVGRCHVDELKRSQFFFDTEERIITLV